MTKSIAIIGSGEMAVIIAKEARKMGIVSHSFSNNPKDRVVGISDQHHNVDIFNLEELVKTCLRLDVSGVISTTELTVSVAAKIADRMHFTGLPIGIAEKITDKGFVREKVSKITSIKQPTYNVWNKGEKLPKIQEYPVVVKPTSMGGKRGVTIVESEKELQSALQYSLENMSASFTGIIIEGYIEGTKEYSVETLSYQGSHKVIQITEKISSGIPNFVELGHMQPAAISAKVRSEIEHAVIELLTVTGVNNTSAHTEVKLVSDDIYLIELNARLGGDHISYPLTGISTGYPYIQGAISIAMGDYIEPNIEKFEKNNSGIIFITEQTSQFKDLFDESEKYPWLYKKNQVSKGLKKLINNQAFDTNYMIYKSENDIPLEIKNILSNK